MSESKYKQTVRSAFNNFVMVNQTLVKYFKDANVALFLGYLISEDAYFESENKLDQFGYFYCTSKKFEEKFGLSHKAQDTIISKLLEAQLIKVVNKKVEGCEGISKKKHFKVLHWNIYNLVNCIKIEKQQPDRLLKPRLLAIEQALRDFAKSRRATSYTTPDDEKVLKIADLHGLCPEIINQSIKDRHPRLKGKDVNAKYLLSAFIPDFSTFEDLPDPYPRSELVLNLG